MTTSNTSIYTPFADGRTVHDIVEHSPALVNEKWCNNLLRHVLDSLEQQYASGAPHRHISPDTLVMLNNGEALLLPSSEDAAAADGLPAEDKLAADLHALAMVVHYAITAELPPDGPIGPRLYDNYSEVLTQGLDRCLGPNLRLRPRSIAEMRSLLKLEAVQREETATTGAGLAPLEPASAHVAPTEIDDIASAHFAEERLPEPVSAGSPEPVADVPAELSAEFPAELQAGSVPEPVGAAQSVSPSGVEVPPVNNPAPPSVAGAQSNSADAMPKPAHIAFTPASAAGKPKPDHSGEGSKHGRAQRWAMMAGAAVVLLAAGSALVAFLQESDSRDLVPPVLPVAGPVASTAEPATVPGGTAAPTAAATAEAPAAPGAGQTAAAPDLLEPGIAPGAVAAQGGVVHAGDAVVNGTTYKLLVKPWGTVYVDGVDRGVSPPVKRLTLAPGKHTIRIVNPNFPEYERTVNAGVGTDKAAAIEHDFTAETE